MAKIYFWEKFLKYSVIFTHRCTVLVESGLVVLVKISKSWLVYIFTICLNLPMKMDSPCLILNKLSSSLPKICFGPRVLEIGLMVIIQLIFLKLKLSKFLHFSPLFPFGKILLSPLGKGWDPSFGKKKLNPLHSKMLCAKFGWNWSIGSGEEEKNVKNLQTNRGTDNRRQAIRKAHLSFQLRCMYMIIDQKF